MSLVAFGLYLASWMASPQPFAVQLAAAPDAQVAGRVVDAISRAPIAGATVMLVPLMPKLPSSPVPRGTVTDADGNFIFPRLVPGRYRIVARSTEQTIDVAAGQSVMDVELALQPSAVIAGRIVDANGGSVSDVTVEAFRQQTGPDAQAPGTTSPLTAQTNDRGEFRLEGLAEGNYLLLAAPPFPPAFAAPPAPAMVVAPTYYPGTPNKETAEVVTVVSGQAIDHLQFSLLMLPAREVSGVVVDEAGSPVADAIVVLTSDATTGGPRRPATGQTDQNGAFRIGGIASGPYRVTVGTPALPVARSGPVLSAVLGAAALVPIAVGDMDVTGLRLVLPAKPNTSRAKPVAGPVKPTVQVETWKIVSVTILPDVREIKVGDTVVFRPQVQLSAGVPPPWPRWGAPSWETDNPAVVAVTVGTCEAPPGQCDGSLTALAPGLVTLSVRVGGISATRVLRIIP